MILRVFPAGIIGLLMAIYLGVRPMPWQAWARIAAAALIGNVGYQVLSIFGAQYIPASWIGMLFGLEPVFIALFAVVLAGDRITSWLIGGMTLAMVGTATLMLGNVLAPDKDVGLLGLVLVTLGTMGWGIYTVLVQPRLGKIRLHPGRQPRPRHLRLPYGCSSLHPTFRTSFRPWVHCNGWSCLSSSFSAPFLAPLPGTLPWAI